LSVAKSDLIKELADSYPNFLRKDLIRLMDIALYEMINSLKRGERVELRDVFTIEEYREIQKQMKQLIHLKKKKYCLKFLKLGQKK